MQGKTLRHRRQRGQTITEYILIIAVVVVASVGILSVFSDTVRQKISGIIHVINPSSDTSSADTGSKEIMQSLDKSGGYTGSGN